MKFLLIAGAAGSLLLGTAAIAASDGAHWTYAGESGPDHWRDLAPEFASCGNGAMQSPIDLGQPGARGIVNVVAGYRAGAVSVVNNGHTIQANFAKGSQLVSGDRFFELLQVHFHTPSEHAVSGKRYPLVAHFVHRDTAGELAVLGVFFEEGPANEELGKIIAAAPRHHADIVTMEGVALNPDHLVPDNLSVYRYMGSLTTPPCSEGVNWHVAMKPLTASREQIEAMQMIMGHNARPLQQLNHRLLVSR